MANFVALPIFDGMLRKSRPAFGNVPFSAITAAMTCDSFYVPIVGGAGILFPLATILSQLSTNHHSLTHEMLIMELSTSISQGYDLTHAQVLNRIRKAECASEDTMLLNTRYLDDFTSLTSHDSMWLLAPMAFSRAPEL